MSDPTYETRNPHEMTREELVRALAEWQANTDTRLDVIGDLIDAARIRLAQTTYQDGIDATRCCLCLQEVKP